MGSSLAGKALNISVYKKIEHFYCRVHLSFNFLMKVFDRTYCTLYLIGFEKKMFLYIWFNFAGMSDISPAKKMSMANSLRFLEDMREKTLNMLKSDR